MILRDHHDFQFSYGRGTDYSASSVTGRPDSLPLTPGHWRDE